MRETTRYGAIIVTYVKSREKVRDIVEAVREMNCEIRLINLSKQNPILEDSDVSEVDVEILTDKQLEAIEAAQKLGYYDSTDTVTLEDLANELGITPSAVSQRLTRAQKNRRPDM